MPDAAAAAAADLDEILEAEPPKEPPAPVRPQWPSEWTLHFSVNGDWTIDNEMLSLSADEVKVPGGAS